MQTPYNIIIIGAGAAGLVVASVAAQLGLKVLLVEKQARMGGDCLHFGCVPSKALLHVGRIAQTLRGAADWGFDLDGQRLAASVDMAAVNAAVQRAVAALQQHDSHQRFEQLGCELLTGEARFVDAHRIEVDGRQYRAQGFVIATGSCPVIPDLPGLRGVATLTNEQMFSLPSKPESLLILGGGPVGVEMAQAFCRLGSRVTLVESQPQILPRLAADHAAVLQRRLQDEGVDVRVGETLESVAECGERRCVRLRSGASLEVEKILVALGRRPVLQSLALEKAGVVFDEGGGIAVNARMQTSRKHIYACGDVVGAPMLTHAAELEAGVVIANLVFRLPRKIDYRVLPAVVYTEPELAVVGVTSQQAKSLTGIEIQRFDYADLDRAVTDACPQGGARLITRKGRIIGAEIVGAHAGELIHELALAIGANMKVARLASLVHAYPAYSQLNKRLAGQYYRHRLFGVWSRRWAQAIFKWFTRNPI